MGVNGIFKRIGRVVAMPVTAPVKAVKRGAEKTMQAAIMGIVRHLLTYAGGMLTFTGDDLTQFVGAATALIGLFWSLWDKRKAATA